MPASLTMLRSGESFDFEIFPLQSDGSPSFITNELFNKTGVGVFDFDVDVSNDRLIHGDAVFPGSNTLRLTAVDGFFDNLQQDFPVVVLDAMSILFKFGAPTASFTYSIQNGTLVVVIIDDATPRELDVSILAIDERYAGEPRSMPDYTAGLSSIQWSEDGSGIVSFNGNPTQSGGTTSTIFFQDYGEGFIRVTANNRSGNPIEGQIPVRILGATTQITGVFTLT